MRGSDSGTDVEAAAGSAALAVVAPIIEIAATAAATIVCFI
jgi:hypothetical protein